MFSRMPFISVKANQLLVKTSLSQLQKSFNAKPIHRLMSSVNQVRSDFNQNLPTVMVRFKDFKSGDARRLLQSFDINAPAEFVPLLDAIFASHCFRSNLESVDTIKQMLATRLPIKISEEYGSLFASTLMKFGGEMVLSELLSGDRESPTMQLLRINKYIFIDDDDKSALQDIEHKITELVNHNNSYSDEQKVEKIAHICFCLQKAVNKMKKHQDAYVTNEKLLAFIRMLSNDVNTSPALITAIFQEIKKLSAYYFDAGIWQGNEW